MQFIFTNFSTKRFNTKIHNSIHSVLSLQYIFNQDHFFYRSIGPASAENKSNRILKCCYTNDVPINEALWCNFHLSKPEINSTYFRDSEKFKQIDLNSKNSKSHEELKNCVCIMDSNSIKFYTKAGKEYLTALQFNVHKIWPSKYGLILERKLEKKEYIQKREESDFLKPELPVPSLQSFCISYNRNNSVSLHKQSIEQSFLQNQKNFTDFGEKSTTFGSTQYLNLPGNIRDHLSPINYSDSNGASLAASCGTSYATSYSTSQGTSLVGNSAAGLPIIFSLSHPLDEICPVVVKKGKAYCFYDYITLVFVSLKTIVINIFF